MPGDPPDDLDDRFARIVAGYDSPVRDDATRPWPVSEEVSDKAPAWTEQEPAGPYESSGWDDEGHYVPPAVPPVPRPAPGMLFAWLGVLGAPLVFLLIAFVGWSPPRVVTGTLVLCFVAGVVMLIARIARPGPDGLDPDDGAVV